MSRKLNPVLLIASVASLLVYLFAPILRIAFVLSLNGMNAGRWLSEWFYIPAAMLFISAVAACTGNRKWHIGASALSCLTMLIMLLALGDIVAAGNLNAITTLLGSAAGNAMGAPASGNLAASAMSQLLVNAAWGFFTSLIIAVAGLAMVLFMENSGSSRAGSGRGNNYAQRQNTYGNLYRK